MPRLIAPDKQKSSPASKAGPYVIEAPTDNDILPGRGKHVYSHKGNNYFLSLVKKYEFKNVSCPKALKPVYAKAIYTCIRNLEPPGRFLKAASEDENEETWVEMSPEEALTKIRQAMRDNTIRIKRKKKHVEIQAHCGIPLVNAISLTHPNAKISLLSKTCKSSFHGNVHSDGSISTIPRRLPFLRSPLEQMAALPIYEAAALEAIRRRNMMIYPNQLQALYVARNNHLANQHRLKSSATMPHYYMNRHNMETVKKFATGI